MFQRTASQGGMMNLQHFKYKKNVLPIANENNHLISRLVYCQKECLFNLKSKGISRLSGTKRCGLLLLFVRTIKKKFLRP